METAASRDPVAEIRAAREMARQQQDPYTDVCFLATVAADGRPALRALVLRDIDVHGFALLLNATSPKWQQLTATGRCTLLLLWLSVRRQYRIDGRIEPMPHERLQQYWQRKGYGSKLLEHYYGAFQGQSQPLPSRATLLQGMQELRRRYPDPLAIPLPDTLRGIYLSPTTIEVWHGSPEDLLHDRQLFTRTETGWSSAVLVP